MFETTTQIIIHFGSTNGIQDAGSLVTNRPTRIDDKKNINQGSRFFEPIQSLNLYVQEISNRTHRTDPEKNWVSNISVSSNLLRGPLVRSYSIFDGLWILLDSPSI